MTKQDIPHGHGLSYKKGIADGILDESLHEDSVHETHLASYKRGFEEGVALRTSVANRVKPSSE